MAKGLESKLNGERRVFIEFIEDKDLIHLPEPINLRYDRKNQIYYNSAGKQVNLYEYID